MQRSVLTLPRGQCSHSGFRSRVAALLLLVIQELMRSRPSCDCWLRFREFI